MNLMEAVELVAFEVKKFEDGKDNMFNDSEPNRLDTALALISGFDDELRGHAVNILEDMLDSIENK